MNIAEIIGSVIIFCFKLLFWTGVVGVVVYAGTMAYLMGKCDHRRKLFDLQYDLRKEWEKIADIERDNLNLKEEIKKYQNLDENFPRYVLRMHNAERELERLLDIGYEEYKLKKIKEEGNDEEVG